MVNTYDVGSMPFTGDFEAFSIGARPTDPLLKMLDIDTYSVEKKYFEEQIIQSFIGKVKAGIDVPNYPQFRDMNEMFLDLIKGVEKTKNGYQMADTLSIKERPLISEVRVLRDKAKDISNRIHGPFTFKISVTGPYTLSSAFVRKDIELLKGLGEMISKIIKYNCYSGKLCEVVLVAVDEPIFGLLDDPTLDFGSIGRDILLKTWEEIFYQVKSSGARSCIHLHNTSNELFWQIKHLDIIESHVDDPLYSSSRTRKLLEKEDKYLKASVSVTNFDLLIRNRVETQFGQIDEDTVNQRVSNTWTGIQNGSLDPTLFLESLDVVKARLLKIIDRYGVERVLYAGPECGLRSFPTLNSATEHLKIVAEATSIVNTGLPDA